MKARFLYSFDEIDKKLLRKSKGLKKKEKYTLKQAEALVLWVQQNWQYDTAITLVCEDSEERAVYAFDGIMVSPLAGGAKPVNLLQEIEHQILNEDGIEDANRLLGAINEQYREEPSVQQAQAPAKKKALGLKIAIPKLPFKSKKQRMDNELESDYEENYELEAEPEEYNTAEEAEEINDFEPEDDYANEEPEVAQTDGDNEEQFEFDDEPENEVTTSSQDNFGVQSYQPQVPMQQATAVTLEMIEQIVQSAKPTKKHETVIFPTLAEYSELGEEIEEAINQMVQKLEVDSLYRFIGIPALGASNTRLDEYRIEYAKNKLSEAKFENLRQHYTTQVNATTAEAMETLRNAVDRAWKKPYDLEVKEQRAEEIEAIQAEAEDRINEFVERQQEILDEKIKKMELEQQQALHNFIAQQEAEKNTFVATEEERIQTLIDTKSETINSQTKEALDQFMDEEIYKMKAEVIRNLFDGKRKVKQETASVVADANEDTWKVTMEFIQEIQKEINELTPTWAKQAKELNILEQQSHQRDKEVKELQLREEELNLRKMEANRDIKKQEELEQENKLLKIKLETAMAKNDLLEYAEEHQKQAVGQARTMKPFRAFNR